MIDAEVSMSALDLIRLQDVYDRLPVNDPGRYLLTQVMAGIHRRIPAQNYESFLRQLLDLDSDRQSQHPTTTTKEYLR